MDTSSKLSKERVGEIAIIAFLQIKRREGIILRPGEVKRDISNEAKRHGLHPVEVALFAKFVTEEIYKESMQELDSVIATQERPRKNGQG